MHTAAEEHLSKVCPLMRRVILKHGPCTLEPEAKRSPFESLVHAVAHQQLHAKAAESILKRFRALFAGRAFPKPEHILAIEDEPFRGSGFSFGKMKAIRDIARKAQEGVIPTRAQAHKLEDAALIERLTSVHGVGQWTVEMLLIFTLGRPDVFPSDDFGVRNGFRVAKKLPEMPKPRELREYAERWRPHRTVAAWYLWRVADASKEKSAK